MKDSPDPAMAARVCKDFEEESDVYPTRVKMCKYSYTAWCPVCERTAPRRRTKSESMEASCHRRRSREMKSFSSKKYEHRCEYEENLELYEPPQLDMHDLRFERVRSNLCELPTTYISNNCQLHASHTNLSLASSSSHRSHLRDHHSKFAMENGDTASPIDKDETPSNSMRESRKGAQSADRAFTISHNPLVMEGLDDLRAHLQELKHSTLHRRSAKSADVKPMHYGNRVGSGFRQEDKMKLKDREDVSMQHTKKPNSRLVLKGKRADALDCHDLSMTMCQTEDFMTGRNYTYSQPLEPVENDKSALRFAKLVDMYTNNKKLRDVKNEELREQIKAVPTPSVRNPTVTQRKTNDNGKNKLRKEDSTMKDEQEVPKERKEAAKMKEEPLKEKPLSEASRRQKCKILVQNRDVKDRKVMPAKNKKPPTTKISECKDAFKDRDSSGVKDVDKTLPTPRKINSSFKAQRSVEKSDRVDAAKKKEENAQKNNEHAQVQLKEAQNAKSFHRNVIVSPLPTRREVMVATINVPDPDCKMLRASYPKYLMNCDERDEMPRKSKPAKTIYPRLPYKKRSAFPGCGTDRSAPEQCLRVVPLNLNGAAAYGETSRTSRYPMRTSLFPNIPPYISFSMHNDEPNQLPLSKHYMKWKLTTITPVVVRKTLQNTGFRLVRRDDLPPLPFLRRVCREKSNEWVGTWGKHMKSHMFQSLHPSQKLNHYAGSFQLGRKDRLWKNVQRMIGRFGAKEFGFIPRTYVLPQDLRSLKQNWRYKDGSAGEKWILKPPASARGVGIRIINKWTQLPKQSAIVVQRYIANPYLINASKFDLRLYVLVTSFNPLRIYLYTEGLVRFASAKYSGDDKDLSDKFMHLTNYSINKLSSQYTANDDANACFGHKWTLTKLWDYFALRGINIPLLWATLSQLVIKTMMSGEHSISKHCNENVTSRYNCYELFGIDVLLDETLRPWLLEVNISPSLHSTSPLDLHVKGPLVQSIFNMAQFHLPTRIATADAWAPECFNSALYTTTLTGDEMHKHNFFEQMQRRDVYLRQILDQLTGDDVRVLIQAEDELVVKAKFDRIFPTADTYEYLHFMPSRYYNRLFDAWENTYANNRQEGIRRLKKLCEQKIHLPASQRRKKSLSMSQESWSTSSERDMDLDGSTPSLNSEMSTKTDT